MGKTATAIRLAKQWNSVIISADSRQIYREMNIGTAKPTLEEQKAAPHYLIDFLSIREAYSAWQFEEQALALLDDLWQKHSIIIVAGGSGLYVEALCQGLSIMPPIPKEVHKRIADRYQSGGLEALCKALAEADPLYYRQVDRQNPHRVMRALAVCWASSTPFSSLREVPRPKRSFKVIKVGLTLSRDTLCQRIDLRVDHMVAAGLFEEAMALYPQRDRKALKTIGYQEIFAYQAGQYDRNAAITSIKQHTRQYAKRQMTWWKRDPSIFWIAPKAHHMIDNYINAQLAH